MPPFIILAGGEGRRLKDAVPDRPKPLAPINGLPFLQYLIENLYKQGVRDIVLSLHHQAHLIEDFVQRYSRPTDLTLRAVTEPEPLGTGGAIRHIVRTLNLNAPFYVGNGDTYLPQGYAEFADKRGLLPSRNLIGLVHVADASRYGKVELDSASKIVAFNEKAADQGPGWVNSGLYFLTPDSVDLPDARFSIETRVFPLLLQQAKLYGVRLDSDFIDIGVPGDYRRFASFLAKHKGKQPC